MKKEKYSGVWIFAEQNDGKLHNVTLELIGKGRELADTLAVNLTAILLGEDVMHICQDLIHSGADEVLVASDPMLKSYNTDSYTDIISEQILSSWSIEFNWHNLSSES